MVQLLKTGGAWNPLKAWPRNEPCFCDSGRKFKHCHLPNLPEAISAADAAPLIKFMADKKAGKKVKLIINPPTAPEAQEPEAPNPQETPDAPH